MNLRREHFRVCPAEAKRLSARTCVRADRAVAEPSPCNVLSQRTRYASILLPYGFGEGRQSDATCNRRLSLVEAEIVSKTVATG